MELNVNIPNDRYISIEDFIEGNALNEVKFGKEGTKRLSAKLYEVNDIKVWRVPANDATRLELVTDKGFLSFSAAHRFIQLCRLWTISCKDGSSLPVSSDNEGNIYFEEPKSKTRWKINISNVSNFNELSFLFALAHIQKKGEGQLYLEVGQDKTVDIQNNINWDKVQARKLSLVDINRIKEHYIEYLLRTYANMQEQGALARTFKSPYKIISAEEIWVKVVTVRDTVQSNTVTESRIPLERNKMSRVKRPAGLFNGWLNYLNESQVLSATFAGRCNCVDGKEICSACDGSKLIFCPECDGSGYKKCPSCGGRGSCSECGGSGVTTETYGVEKTGVRYYNAPYESSGYDSEVYTYMDSESRLVSCPSCSGTGNCSNCDGRGEISCHRCSRSNNHMITCDNCDNNGETSCSICNGKLTFADATRLTVNKKVFTEKAVLDYPGLILGNIQGVVDEKELNRMTEGGDDYIYLGRFISNKRPDKLGGIDLSHLMYCLNASEELRMGTKDIRLVKEEIDFYAKKLVLTKVIYKNEEYTLLINEHIGRFNWFKQ